MNSKEENEFVDKLNTQADMLPQMMNLYRFIIENNGKAFDYESMVTLVQAAFWIGMEVGVSRQYDEFRDNLLRLIEE